MNCSEYLVGFLIKHGVKDIFGYAGGYIVPFMDALYFRREEINVHVCYHEQGCALAAGGYARISGRLGVYFTTSGPGAVNALGGLADAWFDGIPVLGICGNVPTNEMKGIHGKNHYKVFRYGKQCGRICGYRRQGIQYCPVGKKRGCPH